MLTKWVYSPETEAKRLVHAARQIAVGFYKANNFLVLPDLPKGNEIVVFPKLNYLSISRFWDSVSRINVDNFPIKVEPDFLEKVAILLATSKIRVPKFKELQGKWNVYEKDLISQIYRIIPSKKNSIKNIIIMPTTIGTSCSFNMPKKFPTTIYIWIREDQGIASIVEAILTALTRNDVYESLGGIWQESEIIVDFLLAYSPLSEILRKADPNYLKTLTIKGTRSKQNGALQEKSEAYLKEIGAPISEKIFSLNGRMPLLREKPFVNLSSRERQLLALLIGKSPNSASIDEVAEILFSDSYNGFSLEAIAKVVQRLRDKLEANGVSGSFIQTKRGEGYLLVN